MQAGIVTLQPSKNPRTKAAGLARHQKIMLGIAIPSLILGTAAIISYKISKGMQHFHSLHAVRHPVRPVRCGTDAVSISDSHCCLLCGSSSRLFSARAAFGSTVGCSAMTKRARSVYGSGTVRPGPDLPCPQVLTFPQARLAICCSSFSRPSSGPVQSTLTSSTQTHRTRPASSRSPSPRFSSSRVSTLVRG